MGNDNWDRINRPPPPLLREYIDELRAQRDEAWDLIDRMIPYVRQGSTDCEPYGEGPDLLAEIEEKRKPHG